MSNQIEHPTTFTTETDELSLLDIIDFFKSHWQQIAISTVICSLAGWTYAFLATPKYQATANLTMTMVGSTTTTTTTSMPVEQPAALQESIKLPFYFSEMNLKACLLDSDQYQLLSNSIISTINKNSPVINLSYKSSTPTAAISCLGSIIQTIQNKQAAMAYSTIFSNKELMNSYLNRLSELKNADKQYIATKKNQLETLRSKLLADEKLQTSLSTKDLNFDFKSDNFAASSLLITLITSKDNEIKEIKNQIVDIELFLANPQTPNEQNINELSAKISVLKIASSPPLTQTATLVTPIYTPDTPVEPKKALIILIATVLGGFIGVLYALLANLLKTLKKDRLSQVRP